MEFLLLRTTILQNIKKIEKVKLQQTIRSFLMQSGMQRFLKIEIRNLFRDLLTRYTPAAEEPYI